MNPFPSMPTPCPQRASWRMTDWLLLALLLSLAVWWMAPQQLPVSLYKLSLVALAAVAGYWIDRSLFPYARPDAFLQLEDLEGFEVEAQLAGDPPRAFDEFDEPHWLQAAEPNEALLRVMGVCMLRRAIIVAATMLAVGMGA